MKNLKKNLLAGLAFVFAFGAAFALDISKRASETPLWREIPGSGGIMEYITPKCTLTIPSVLCSIIYPSQDGLYWKDVNKTHPPSGIPSQVVFLEWH